MCVWTCVRHVLCDCASAMTECLSNLETGLEGKLQLAALDDNVGEVEEVDLQRVQHALPRHDDLLRLFFHRQ